MTQVDRALTDPRYPQIALLRALDRRRVAMGVSRRQWAAAAAVSERSIIRVVRGHCVARPDTIAKLRKALDRLDAGRGVAAGVMPRETIKAIYTGFLLAACHALSVPADLALSIDPREAPRGAAADDATRAAHAARRIALYLANVQAGLAQGQLAGMLGIDKAAVSRAISGLEDARDDADFEALVQRAARLMDQGDVW